MSAVQEVDALNVGTMATTERAKKMDFAYIMWAEPYAMVVPRSGEGPRLFAFIRPFTPMVITISVFLNQSDLCAYGKLRNYEMKRSLKLIKRHCSSN